MQMPLPLQEAIERVLEDLTPQEVHDAALRLSRRYRTDEKAPTGARLLTAAAEMRAYCAFRMPATYAALVRAMGMLRDAGLARVQTLTDVGSGSGSALWAAQTVFPEIAGTYLIEREADMIDLAKKLAQSGEACDAQWIQADMRSAPLPPADLVTASFCLGELSQGQDEELVRRLWEAARGALLLVEPGTPAGYSRIRRYAALLRGMGAHMAAPCPGRWDCPLDSQDWCHFTVRVERTRLHRYVKDGTLPYEDEKFSFLAATREPAHPAQARIRRRPMIRGGFVELPVCDAAGTHSEKVTRKHPQYKQARKAEVGDPWEEA